MAQNLTFILMTQSNTFNVSKDELEPIADKMKTSKFPGALYGQQNGS